MGENQTPGPLDRLFKIFGDVHTGEGGTVFLMFLNVFLLLVGYYTPAATPLPLR